MKAIVLWQPWASLMAAGLKRNETRGRPWSFVGDVAICAAALRWRTDVPNYAETALCRMWEHRKLFGDFKGIKELYDSLPFGKVVCVVRKTGCVPTSGDNGDDRSLTPLELDLGDYSPGRFYYPTADLRPLVRPVGVRGGQFVFDLDPGTEAAVRRQL